MENERERQLMEINKLNNNNRNKDYKFLKFNSQRVIYPEKNTEIKRANKKRTYRSQEKNLLHTTGGRITTLLDKTPLQYENKGKKILNNSIDYGRKKDTNIFSEEFLNDKNYNRIPGVKRKHIIPRVNMETFNHDDFSAGRKHFFYYRK
jgi:hypothetical protein